MAPEQKARQQIDRQLEQAGWIVQDFAQMNISAGPALPFANSGC
jgi:type I restriction enzyme R subunit